MNSLPKIKICGMKYPQNILEVASMSPDYIGFIFYEKSKRVVNDNTFSVTPKNCKRIGVFVNQPLEFIKNQINNHDLDGVQLHGEEMPQICSELKKQALVLKAFLINENFDFNILNDYQLVVDYFLFDTQTNSTEKGGTGKKFDWNLLKNYSLNIPFFLSGGISVEDVNEIKQFSHPQFYGIDINSRFEISEGLKDVQKLSTFINQLRNDE